MYQVICRTPDNSDGIYRDGTLVISEYTLRTNGYQLERVINYNQKTLARLVDELNRPPRYR